MRLYSEAVDERTTPSNESLDASLPTTPTKEKRHETGRRHEGNLRLGVVVKSIHQCDATGTEWEQGERGMKIPCHSCT